jgi:antirestriction protein ArdC
MKRDLYAEVTARIVAELEAGAAPWIKPWSATAGANTPCNAVTNRPYSGCNIVLLWMAQAAGYRTPRYLTFKQALELGGAVRKGQHGTKVYFVKQLQVRDKGVEDEVATRIVPMMREYTVFNVDQCDNLPDRVLTLGEIKVRNRDERDATIDEFLVASGAPIREGAGEAYYRPSDDFISIPSFESFKSAAHFYGVAFHELGHWTGHKSRPVLWHMQWPPLAQRPVPRPHTHVRRSGGADRGQGAADYLRGLGCVTNNRRQQRERGAP